MVKSTVAVSENMEQLVRVNDITLDHPWRWIAAGWKDFKSAPKLSIAYGGAVTIVSYVVVLSAYYSGMIFFVLPLLTGFFLVAPILAVGLYEISRSLQSGQKPTAESIIKVLQKNSFELVSLGLVLMMAFLAWILVANLVVALFMSGLTPKLDNLFVDLFLSGQHPLLFLVGIGVGGLLAFFVYSVSVISAPAVLDRDINIVTALSYSVQSVRSNPRPMLLWAGLIVMFIGIGMMTFFIGLVVFMPLIGYATWHAYQDLVEPVSEG